MATSQPTEVGPHADGGMEFRAGIESLVPYLRFPDRDRQGDACSPEAFRDSILGVDLGPKLEPELGSIAVMGFLSSQGISIGVGLSGIPLRRR